MIWKCCVCKRHILLVSSNKDKHIKWQKKQFNILETLRTISVVVIGEHKDNSLIAHQSFANDNHMM